MPRLGPPLLLVLSLALAPGCKPRPAREPEAPGAAARTPAAFDWSRPQAGLALDADEVAARVGPFEWEATAEWTVVKASAPDHPIHVSERHRLRQRRGGPFEVSTALEPGTWRGAETGRTLVFDGERTYARGQWSPAGGAFRARDDRPEEARRHREESFGLAEQVALLCGPALTVEPAGEGRAASRPARRFALRLGPDRPAPEAPPPGRATDPDTRRRLGLLEGRVPRSLEGELLADAATGAPLAVSLKAVFGTRDDPGVRVELTLHAAVTRVGEGVPPVAAPEKLAPEPKPHGVARALEAVGLRKKGEGAPAGGAEEEEPDELGPAEGPR